jgi:hypothetical protein
MRRGQRASAAHLAEGAVEAAVGVVTDRPIGHAVLGYGRTLRGFCTCGLYYRFGKESVIYAFLG